MVETSIKFLGSAMKASSVLEGAAGVFLLENVGIKNETNTRYVSWVQRQSWTSSKSCDSRVISVCIFQQLVFVLVCVRGTRTTPYRCPAHRAEYTIACGRVQAGKCPVPTADVYVCRPAFCWVDTVK